MFLNVRSSRFWEDNLRQRIGFVGPTEAFTEEDCMRRAMGLFMNLFSTHLKYGAYGFLLTLYHRFAALYVADWDDVFPVFSIHEIAKGTPILWNYNP